MSFRSILGQWLSKLGRGRRPQSGGARRHSARLTLETLEDRLCPSSATLAYSTFLGGSGFDVVYAVATDQAGNTYVTGLTTSTDFPVTSGAFQTKYAGGIKKGGSTDAFVAKFNPAGGLVYATYLGGNGFNLGDSIAVDQYGDAYVLGKTTASNFPVKNGFQTSYGGNTDAFVAELNPTGSALLYSTYLGGSGEENHSGSWDSPVGGIAVDGTGNAYVTGVTFSSNFPTRNGLPATTGSAYVARINTNVAGAASLVYSTFLDANTATGIAVDGSGDAYVTGVAAASLATTPGAFQTSGATGYVAKLNTNLAGSASLVYATYLGAADLYPRGIAVDQAGDAYVAGDATGGGLSTTTNAFQATYAGYHDAFVAELNPAGTGLVYATYLGGTGDGWAQAIAVDGAGHIYITGLTGSRDLPTPNGFQNALNGGQDAFVAELDPAAATGPGSLIYASYLGGSSNDAGYGIAVDGAGDAFVVGQASPGFPTMNAFQASYHGGFVTKIAPPT
jgi:hypothetical protein